MGCHSTSELCSSSIASMSRRLNASIPRLKASTFSCDIPTQYPPIRARGRRRSGAGGRRRVHQLDAMSRWADREGAALAPELPALLHLEAGRCERAEGCLEVLDHDCGMTELRHGC